MKKLLKTVLALGAMAALIACMAMFAACGGDDGTEAVKYGITVEESVNGTIAASAAEAAEGDEVTITATPDSGYRLDELKVDGETVTVTGNQYKFTMPAKAVTVEGTFVENLFSVTLKKTENGSATLSTKSAVPGETVKVTAEPDFGYTLDAVTVNGTAAAVSGNEATFTMPEADAEVSVTFKTIAGTIESVPATTAFEIDVKATAGKTATSHWTVVFGDSSVKVAVYVEDETVTDRDAVAVYFGKSGYENAKITAGNIGAEQAATGELSLYVGTNKGEYTDGDAKITATVAPWGETAGELSGYKVTFEAAYSALGFTDKASAQGSLTVLPVHFNSDSVRANDGTVENGDPDNPGSYPVFSADNTWEANYYALGTGQLGDGNAISAGRYWDLSKDYAAEDTDNYANREAKLTGHDNADNDIVFFRAEGDTLFAQATIKVDSVVGNELWGKFGLMLFDGASKTGVFFYVDAEIGEGTASVENIRGTSLGYNSASGNWGSWNPIASTGGSFNLQTHTITLAMAYYDNMLYMYCGDQLVHSMYYVAKTDDLQIGMKSFAYTLTVTDYTASDDPSVVADYIPDIEPEAVDVLFAGDSYMEFLVNYGCYDSLTSEIDTEANEGVGGTKVPYWTGDSVVNMLEKFYIPENIVFHIGVNDINVANSAVDSVYTNLVGLFDLYHTTFATADIWWVSLIPNMSHPGNTSKYLSLNEKVQALAQTEEYKEWLNYIDVTTAFSTGDGETPEARASMFVSDGLHLSAEYGYPLWMKIIKEALGYPVEDGNNVLGYNTAGFMPTNGWAYEEDGSAKNTGIGEVATYSKQAPAADIYFKAELKKGGTYNNDGYPKIGLILRNDEMTLFAYIDAEPALLAQGNVAIVSRSLNVQGGKTLGSANWDWNNQSAKYTTSKDCTEDFVEIGFGKLGNKLFVTIDGVRVIEWTLSSVEAADEFVAGVIGFNSEIFVQNTSITTETDSVTVAYNKTTADVEET